jgi:very-short-patch-repair endonuclease
MRDTERTSRPRAKAMRREMTKAELVLWNHLREANRHGFKFRRQHPIGSYIADFAHIRGQLVIEIDGATHGTADELDHDCRRTAFLQSQGWAVLRFSNTDIFENVSGVVEVLVARLSPHPNVAPRRSTSPASGRGNGAQ